MSDDGPVSGAEHYEVLAHEGPATVLPDSASGGPGPRGRRFAAVGVAAVLVAAVGAGVVAVGAALGGGGTQPEAVVPADAVLYAELDLDPAAAQKVDAYRFLRKFPALKDAFTTDGGYGPGFARLFDGTDVDYAQDIEPWLGKRFAVAVVPGAGESDPARLMLVVQATDEARARTSLGRLAGESRMDGMSVAVSDGYAVLAAPLDRAGRTGQAADGTAAALVAQAQSASLADSAAYVTAIEPYGDTVAVVWADGDRLAKTMKSLSGGLGLGAETGALSGQSVAVLRFDGDTLEVRGQGTGTGQSLSSGGVPAISSLPDTTVAVVGANRVGALLADAVGPLWEQFGARNEGARPGEWPTLFGDQTVLALGAAPGGDGTQPDVGVKVVGGSDTARAVLDLVHRSLLATATAARTADGVVVASSKGWLDEITAGGTFGGSATFAEAVPDAAEAGLIGFVDVHGLVARYGSEMPAEARANLDALRAVGFSAGSSDGATTFRLRVLTD